MRSVEDCGSAAAQEAYQASPEYPRTAQGSFPEEGEIEQSSEAWGPQCR